MFFCVLLILKIHPHYFNWYLNCNGHTCARLESSMYTFTRVPCQTWSAMIQSTTWKDDSLVWLSWFLTAQDTRINQIRIDLNVQIVNIPKVPDRFAHREGFVLFIFETLTRLIIKFRLIKRVKRKVKLSEVINKYVVCMVISLARRCWRSNRSSRLCMHRSVLQILLCCKGWLICNLHHMAF